MKKLTKQLLCGFVLVTALAAAGCGEEGKYNDAKGSLDATMQEMRQLDQKTRSATVANELSSDMLKDASQFDARIQQMNDVIQKQDEFGKKVEADLKIMDEMSQKETKLRGDYVRWKGEAERVLAYKEATEKTKARYEKHKQEFLNGTGSYRRGTLNPWSIFYKGDE